MAWLEKQVESTKRVCVVELRTRTVWERVAQGKSGGRGRIRLAGEYPNEVAAAAAFRARIAQLEAEGYLLIDADTGVDALHPRVDPARTDKSGAPKVTVDEFVLALRRSLDALPEQPRLALVLDALDRTIRGAKLCFRSKGYVCDLGNRGAAKLVLLVTSEDSYWREIGCAAELRIPDIHETEEERIEIEGGSWRGFVAMVRDDAAWKAVADLSCISIELVDDEID